MSEDFVDVKSFEGWISILSVPRRPDFSLKLFTVFNHIIGSAADHLPRIFLFWNILNLEYYHTLLAEKTYSLSNVLVQNSSESPFEKCFCKVYQPCGPTWDRKFYNSEISPFKYKLSFQDSAADCEKKVLKYALVHV